MYPVAQSNGSISDLCGSLQQHPTCLSAKSAFGKRRQDISGTSGEAPKCKVQRETGESQMTGLEDTAMETADTTTGYGEGSAQPTPYRYDRLPRLDDEPAGGLR